MWWHWIKKKLFTELFYISATFENPSFIQKLNMSVELRPGYAT